MTRTVFDNAMTAHVWANQSAPEGRSNNGNFYFHGRRLYSYGSHFLAGIILPGVGPVLTADSYSISTAKHMNYAERATSYKAANLPGLTAIADDLERAALATNPRRDCPAVADRLAAYLDANAARLGDDGGALVLRLSGSRGDWSAFKVRALARAERKAERARAACRKLDRARAAEYAAIPLQLFRQRALGMLDRHSAHRLDSHIKETVAAHRAAGGPRIKAAVWARLKALRAIRKQWENGRQNADKRAAIAALRRIAAGDYSAGGTPLARFPTGRRRAWETLERETLTLLGSHMPGATRARLFRQADIASRAKARLEVREQRRARAAAARAALARTVSSLRDWRDKWNGTESNPTGASLREHLETAAPVQRLRTLQRIDAELESFLAAGRFPALAARLEALRGGEVATRLLDAEAAYNGWDAEQRALRERIARMSPDEKRDAWRAGEPGVDGYGLETGETGPLLRANGAEVSGCNVIAGELETSQGARVPLRHAFRVFQFIAACRRAGLGWEPADVQRKAAGHRMAGPAQIRVGHFRVDRIESSGDFAAGCHRLRWAEVERLAERLGVAGCMADPETISGELEAAE